MDNKPNNIHLCIDQTIPGRMPFQFQAKTETINKIKEIDDSLISIAIANTKTWTVGRTLKVSFFDGDEYVIEKVKSLFREWETYANIKFEFVDQKGDIRVSFELDGRSWSALGRDAVARSIDKPTMHFGWLYPDTEDKEYRRTVLHEIGHSLGCIHEHQNPDPTHKIRWNKEALYKYFKLTNGWNEEDVNINVIDRYDRELTNYSKFDNNSIMIYYIPPQLTEDHIAIGSENISELSETDKEYMKIWYPFV
jgi:serralysin